MLSGFVMDGWMDGGGRGSGGSGGLWKMLLANWYPGMDVWPDGECGDDMLWMSI